MPQNTPQSIPRLRADVAVMWHQKAIKATEISRRSSNLPEKMFLLRKLITLDLEDANKC